LFPGVINVPDNDFVAGALPEHAEGWFVIPRWQTMAPSYEEAVRSLFAIIKQTRGGRFYNYRHAQLGFASLRQEANSVEAWERLAVQQGSGDVLLVPAQFGLRHRGRSAIAANKAFYGNEFGLGVYAIGIMLLTHPERLMHENDLWINCIGDVYDRPDFSDRFSLVPTFLLQHDTIEFGAHGRTTARDCYGSPSGFVVLNLRSKLLKD